MSPRTSTLARTGALALAALLAGACGGQRSGDADPGSEPQEVTIEIAPRSGAPGTEIRIQARGFPANTTVDVGIGPPDSEYDVVKTATTDDRGEVETAVALGEWVQPGSQYVFVVAGPGGEKAVSEPFTARAPDGGSDDQETVTVTGRLTDEGVECRAMRSDDGRLYTLVGDLGDFDTGDRVTVTGTVAEVSTCMQGVTIGVKSITAAEAG